MIYYVATLVYAMNVFLLLFLSFRKIFCKLYDTSSARPVRYFDG